MHIEKHTKPGRSKLDKALERFNHLWYSHEHKTFSLIDCNACYDNFGSNRYLLITVLLLPVWIERDIVSK